MKERLDNRKRLDDQLERAVLDADYYTAKVNLAIDEMLRLKGIKHL